MAEAQAKKYVRVEYQTPRKSHYVCFDCRKQFRKPVDALARISLQGKVLEARLYDSGIVAYSCPQCAQPMTHIGKNFRAPRQDDIEGWEVARRLTNAGFRYAHARGAYPTKLRDVSDFLEENKRKSEGETLLEKWKSA